MKHFGIYQLFIDTRQQERNLLVGFATGESENAAIENFTSDEFRKGYLKAIECNKEDLTKQHLIDAITKNVNELGVWAKTSHERSGLNIAGVSNHVKNACCKTCENCNLYENENTLPSNTYFCKITEEFIPDIEQHYCDDYIAK